MPEQGEQQNPCFHGNWQRGDGSRFAGPQWSEFCAAQDIGDQLLADAEALHDTVYADPLNPTLKETIKSRQYTTVAVGVLGGKKVWAANNSRANPRMIALAESMGYTRVYGVDYMTPGLETDAEQILMNAVEDGTYSLNGQMGFIAASRPVCDTRRQDCAGRAQRWPAPGITIYGQKRVEPIDRE